MQEPLRPVEEAGQTIGPYLAPSEVGGSVAAPQELAEAGGSAAAPEVLREGGGSAAVPLDTREASPPARELGMGSKWCRPNEGEQGTRGSSPKRLQHPIAPT